MVGWWCRLYSGKLSQHGPPYLTQCALHTPLLSVQTVETSARSLALPVPTSGTRCQCSYYSGFWGTREVLPFNIMSYCTFIFYSIYVSAFMMALNLILYIFVSLTWASWLLVFRLCSAVTAAGCTGWSISVWEECVCLSCSWPFFSQRSSWFSLWKLSCCRDTEKNMLESDKRLLEKKNTCSIYKQRSYRSVAAVTVKDWGRRKPFFFLMGQVFFCIFTVTFPCTSVIHAITVLISNCWWKDWMYLRNAVNFCWRLFLNKGTQFTSVALHLFQWENYEMLTVQIRHMSMFVCQQMNAKITRPNLLKSGGISAKQEFVDFLSKSWSSFCLYGWRFLKIEGNEERREEERKTCLIWKVTVVIHSK